MGSAALVSLLQIHLNVLKEMNNRIKDEYPIDTLQSMSAQIQKQETQGLHLHILDNQWPVLHLA